MDALIPFGVPAVQAIQRVKGGSLVLYNALSSGLQALSMWGQCCNVNYIS